MNETEPARATSPVPEPVVMNPGDVVMLKSGGPAMTVKHRLTGGCICTWFVTGNILTSAEFSWDMLVPAKPDK